MKTVRKIIVLVFIVKFLLAGEESFPQYFTLKGKLIDKIGKYPVQDANISASIFKGDISDEKGEFELRFEYGKHRIKISHINYETYYLEVERFEEGILETVIELNPKLIELKGVEIQARKLEYPEIKKFEVNRKSLSKMPSIGEKDIIRSATLFPGIAMANDFSSQLFVWGGNFDKTLIRLDNMPIWNPYHLTGMFSFISSDAIESYALYPAAFPVSFGDYLSGTLDIKTAAQNYEHYEINSTISLLSSSLSLSGPVFASEKYSSAFLVCFRRIYFDLIMKIGKQNLGYYFYDFIGKYSLKSEKDIIIATFLFSGDVFDPFNEGIVKQAPEWGNKGLVLNWLKDIGDDDNIEITLYLTGSYLNSDYFNLNNSEKIFIKNYLNDAAIKASWKISLIDNLSVKNGIEINRVMFDYFWDNIGNNLWNIIDLERRKHPNIDKANYDFFFDHAPGLFSFKKILTKIAFLTESEFKFDNWNVSAGLKIAKLNKANRLYFSGNLNAKYSLSEISSAKIGLGYYNQFFHVIKDRTNNSIFFAPFAVFLTDNRPESAMHYTASWSFSGLNDNIEIGTYYKKFYNITTTIPTIELYRKTKSVSYGSFFEIEEKLKYVSLKASYSLNFAFKKVDYGWIPTYFDQRHSVKIFSELKLTRKWDLNLFWTYGSGLPYTPVKSYFFSFGGDEYDNFDELIAVPVYGAENSKNYPDYHRLDLRLSGNYNWSKFRMRPYLQFFNVYNNSRVSGFEYSSSYRKRQKFGSYIIPSIGIEINSEF